MDCDIIQYRYKQGWTHNIGGRLYNSSKKLKEVEKNQDLKVAENDKPKISHHEEGEKKLDEIK